MIDATVCVVDNGLFTELAQRLAREFYRVLYAVQWEAEFPLLNDRILGDGVTDIERIEDPYLRSVREQTDLYVFPDIFHAGKQQMLEDLGHLVWGSRTGDSLETNRIAFRELQEKLGLPIPDFKVVVGLSSLRKELESHGHCFIKTTSKIRGSMETWEHRDYAQSEYLLDDLACKLGAGKEQVKFIVEEPIETPFETGFDTYNIDGKFPKTPLQGIEVKGKAILVSAQTESPTPKLIDDAMSALAPILKQHRYRNFISAEFRKDILTDPCCRCPNPGIGVEMEMIKNLGEIIMAGSHGELIEPDYEFEFGFQVAIFHDHHEAQWKQFSIPPDLRRWVKLMEYCELDGRTQIVPRLPHGQKIGWLIGVGDSIEEAATHLKENADALKDLPFDIKIDAVEDAVKQAGELEETGIEFSSEPIPEPATVLE